jgi:hypothetical protein
MERGYTNATHNPCPQHVKVGVESCSVDQGRGWSRPFVRLERGVQVERLVRAWEMWCGVVW